MSSVDNKELVKLYFRATRESRSIEYNLNKNFSPTLLRQFYQVQKLIQDLKKILGENVTQIP